MEIIKHLLETTKIKDVMTSSVVTVYDDDDFSLVYEKFLNKRVSHILVIDHGEKLVGLVSPKYFYKTQSPRRVINPNDMDYDPDMITDGEIFYEKDTLDSYILNKVMMKDPFTLTPDDPLTKGIIEMSLRNVSCIPIVYPDRKIAGALHEKEIVRFLAKIIS